MPSQNPSCSGNNVNSEAADFECNICFDLAQDPIVTRCGHLFCWPCLYKWLRFHSQAHECPVCKALIQEEKLVPLYGRGKSTTDPRSRSVPGVEIPSRPTGQRPETAPPPEHNHFPQQQGFGFMGGGWGGFAPIATARFGNFALSASFGGLFPSLLNFQVHGLPNPATMYGAGAGYPYGYPHHHYHGAHAHPHPHAYPRHSHGQEDNYLKLLFIVIGVLVLLTLFYS